MQIKNCENCGKLFASSGSPLCPECFQTKEEQFKNVKKYLSANPGSSAAKISEGTGVPIDVVMSFVRRGHLVGVSGKTVYGTKCAICKKPIPEGRICVACQQALAGSKLDLNSHKSLEHQNPDVRIQKEYNKTVSQMYTMDSIRKRRR